MGASEPITLSRACEVIEIPSGIRGTLPAGAVVRIMQSLGSSYTVATDRGYMYRVDAKDMDALGLSNAATAQAPAVQEGHFQRADGLGSVEDRVRSGDSGQYRGSGSGLLVCDCAPGARREQGSYQDVHDGSRLRYGQRAQGRRGDASSRGCPVSRKFMLKSCSIRHGIPASCRTQPSSSLASTWITAQHKPRHRSMEKESDRPPLAEKTVDSGARPKHSRTKPAAL